MRCICVRINAWIVVVLTALVALGCAGNSGPQQAVDWRPGGVTPQSAPLAGPADAIPLPELGLFAGVLPRGSSVDLTTTLLGCECSLWATNAMPDEGNHIVTLPSSASEPCWAIFGFGNVLASERPYTLQVTLGAAPPARYYAALADYARGCWRVQEVVPSGGADTIALPDDPDLLSPTGVLYLAVITAAGESAVVERVDLTRDVAAPPPLGLSAGDGTRAAGIDVTWTLLTESYPGIVADAINIWRADDSMGPWVQIGSAAAGDTVYHDDYDVPSNLLGYDTIYYYRLTTVAGVAEGLPSGIDHGYRFLHVPQNLIASDNTDPEAIEIDWDDVPAAAGYQLWWRAPDGGGPPDWELLGSTPFGTTSFSHTGDVTGGNSVEKCVYEYHVRAFWNADVGEWSNTDTGFRDGAPVAVLEANPPANLGPFDCELDAGSSFDSGGGAITLYEWDPLGDGGWIDGGTDSTYLKHYSSFGSHDFGLRVTDDEGDTATTTTTVLVPGWAHSWGRAQDEYLLDVAADSQGRLWAVGHTVNPADMWTDALILVYDAASGELLKSMTWGNASKLDYAYGICFDSADNAYVAVSSTAYGAGGQDVGLLRISPTYSLLAAKAWGTNGNDYPESVSADALGNCYIAGWRLGAPDSTLVLKINADASLSWQKSYISAGLASKALDVLLGTNVWVAGYTELPGRSREAMLLKLGADGDLQDQIAWGGLGMDYAKAIALDPLNNRIYLTGTTASFPEDYYHIFLVSFNDADLVVDWRKVWGEEWQTDFGEGIEVIGGNVYIGGTSTSYSWGSLDVVMLKFAAAGTIDFERYFTASANQECYGVTRDAQGALYLGGVAYDNVGFLAETDIGAADVTGAVTALDGDWADLDGSYGDMPGTLADVTGMIDDGNGTATYDALAIQYPVTPPAP